MPSLFVFVMVMNFRVADPGCACLTDWPDPNDPTNYTIYTEDILDANIASFLATGATPSINLCKWISGLSTFGLKQFMDYLKNNPVILEEVAYILACAPEAVLIMGILAMIVLITLAATC